MLEDATDKIRALWCEVAHDSPMWPIHGQYQCRKCGRHYPVQWAGDAAHVRRERVNAIRAGLLSAIAITFLMTPPARAADPVVTESAPQAAMALARYMAGAEQTTQWTTETIEIDAALPKLEKHGHLRAIRRLAPFGRPQYQVLELAGDRTVRQQVITRYLSAEARAAEIPAGSIAINSANYRFRYKGSVKTEGSVAYVFLMTPHEKREGLMKGELWLDSETGAVVRQSGYLVKRSSIFVKRVQITRVTSLRGGTPESRITHLAVDTRLVGRAELMIVERPGAEGEEDIVAVAPGQ